MPGDEFWDLLQNVAQEKLGAIFGPDLERIGSTCAVVETRGLRSLGCYWASCRPGVVGREVRPPADPVCMATPASTRSTFR